MKRIVLLAGISAAALSPAFAADRYIQLHAGVFQQTEDTVAFASDNFLGDVLDTDVSADAEMGFAGGGLIGAYVLPFIALEGEFTIRTANLDNISVDGVSEAIDEELNTYAFMVNGVVRPDLPIPFLPNPYAGIGVGYLTTNLQDLDGEDVDGQFAYQIKAGISFDLLPTPGQLGIEASYLATDDFDVSGNVAADVVNAEYSYGGVSGLVTWKIGF